MKARGAVRAYPPEHGSSIPPDAMEIVVPYTERDLALAAMRRAGALAANMPAAIRLIAVHTVPFPLEFRCCAPAHAHLVEELIEVASHSPVDVQPQIIMARSREDGFRAGVPANSTVVIATRRRPWRTSGERLAAMLSDLGHHVAVFCVE